MRHVTHAGITPHGINKSSAVEWHTFYWARRRHCYCVLLCCRCGEHVLVNVKLHYNALASRRGRRLEVEGVLCGVASRTAQSGEATATR